MSWSHVLVSVLGLSLPISAALAAADPVSPTTAGSAQVTVAEPAQLKVVAQTSQAVWNGVVMAPGGRILVVLPRLANPSGPSLATVTADGSMVPYPDAAWNGPLPAKPGASPGPVSVGPAFIGLNAIRLAPDGALWAVDTGVPVFGKPAIHGGTRLIRIDLATNQVTRILTLPDEVLHPKSMIDDIRFNGAHAYITDAGSPGLIVLDLSTGSFRRVLDQDVGLTAKRPIIVDGEIVRGPDNKPAMIDADQLEVSPDGRTLYVQPLCGPMSRIDTALLDDPAITPAALSQGLQFWYDTPALGGSAILPDGTLLLNDLETDSILALSPDRVLTRLLHDDRLHWADAPFLGPDGVLTVPVPQLDRAAPFHHGKSQIHMPVFLYALHPADLLAAAKRGVEASGAAEDASARQ